MLSTGLHFASESTPLLNLPFKLLILYFEKLIFLPEFLQFG